MNQQRGFTLLETLIAGVILFSALSLAGMALKTARLSSAAAEQNVQLRIPQAMIVSHIKQVLRQASQDTMSGEGRLNGVEYRWEANSTERGAAPTVFDVDSNQLIESPPKYRLFQVTLALRYGTKTDSLSYTEFGVVTAP